MEMLIFGTWQPAASGRTEEVISPFDRDGYRDGAGCRLRRRPRRAGPAEPGAERTVQIISAEAGKAITEAGGEADRSGDLIRLAAFEGTQLYGDALPLDANRENP
jgi:hypothetical protein